LKGLFKGLSRAIKTVEIIKELVEIGLNKVCDMVDEQRTIFNPDQAATFNAILESVTNNQGHLFFIHAAGSS